MKMFFKMISSRHLFIEGNIDFCPRQGDIISGDNQGVGCFFTQNISRRQECLKIGNKTRIEIFILTRKVDVSYFFGLYHVKKALTSHFKIVMWWRGWLREPPYMTSRQKVKNFKNIYTL